MSVGLRTWLDPERSIAISAKLLKKKKRKLLRQRCNLPEEAGMLLTFGKRLNKVCVFWLNMEFGPKASKYIYIRNL